MKTNLDVTNRSLQEYKKDIKDLLNKLNALDELEEEQYLLAAKEILVEIKSRDQEFIRKTKGVFNGHLLFSRHGLCSVLTEKKLGLNPNAPLAEEAIEHMSSTNKYSINLLLNPEKIADFQVSPLVRARQTASLVIPVGLQKAQITIEPALTESTFTPSGINLRNRNDFNHEYEILSFWSNPVKLIFFTLSKWFFANDEVFRQIKAKSDLADEQMKKLVQKFESNDTDESHRKPQLNAQEKIHKIQEIIEHYLKLDESNKGDLWLFGHGYNFRAFFKYIFGIGSTFEYGETRRVYGVEHEGIVSLYSPPYAFVIDQTTGRIRGKYMGSNDRLSRIPLATSVTIPFESSTLDSPSMMQNRLSKSLRNCAESPETEASVAQDQQAIDAVSELSDFEEDDSENSRLFTRFNSL